MSCCCTKTLNYCRQAVCGDIDFDVLAQIDGTHKLVTYFLNRQLIIEKVFAVDENLIFPLDLLNENYEYTIELFDPNGAKILIRKNDIDYDCFKFQTVMSKVLVAVDEESES